MTDVLQLLRECLGGGKTVWVAGDPSNWRLLVQVQRHVKFLLPGEAVLAVAAGPPNGGPFAFTDRRFCWEAAGQYHRLEYPDIRADGIKARGNEVTVPRAVRLRHRPDGHYVARTGTPEAAEKLARLLTALAAESIPLTVTAVQPWMPRRLPGRVARRAKPASGKEPAPAHTAEQLRAMAAAKDPRLPAALAEYRKGDVAELLWELYQDGSPFARSALMDTLAKVRFGWGVWRGAKRIYKAAEEKRDAAAFGYLAYRFDVDEDFSKAVTRRYMRRRAWRFLRRMARQSPANYAYFAAEVLIHFRPEDDRRRESPGYPFMPGRWTACQILHRKSPGYIFGGDGRVHTPHGEFPALLGTTGHAFPELWKESAEPYLHIVVHAKSDVVRDWAIARVRADHTDRLRLLAPEAVYAILASPHERAALFGWELATANIPPEWIDDEALLRALASPHAKLAAAVGEFIKSNRRPGFVPANRWVLAALGDHPVGVGFAADWLKAHHLAELGWPELTRLLAAPLAPARSAALAGLAARPELVRADPAAFAAAADSPFADVREGLCGMLDVAQLDAATAFGLLELPHRDVQLAVRALISKHFLQWNTPGYLLAAAESPDGAVLEWTADMAVRHLAQDPERLVALVPFFSRVLYRVNAGGAVKRRLLDFLRRTLERHPALTDAAAPLLAGLVRSTAKGESESALAAVVRWSGNSPNAAARVREALPDMVVEDGVIRR